MDTKQQQPAAQVPPPSNIPLPPPAPPTPPRTASARSIPAVSSVSPSAATEGAASKPAEPLDMFSGVHESVLAPETATAASDVVLPMGARVARGGIGRMIGIAVAALVLLVILSAVVWAVFFRKSSRAPSVGGVVAPLVNEAPVAPVPVVNQIPSPPVTDQDGDGLSDSDEVLAGTDPANVDTDDDGLSDREEVQIYHTDPLNADTDGDTYLDGGEVQNGYDPKGPGLLFQVPPVVQ